MRSPEFAANPIGVIFDPDELLARYAGGEPLEKLVARPPLPDGQVRSTCCASERRCGRRCRALRVLAADVVGYSQMRADEAGTVAALRQMWENETFDPAVAARNGRVVKLSVPPCEVSCQIELSPPGHRLHLPVTGNITCWRARAVFDHRGESASFTRGPPSSLALTPGIPCAGGLAMWC